MVKKFIPFKKKIPVSRLSLISPGIRNLMRKNVYLAKNGANDKTSRKQRICWSLELHKRFVNALQQLGGLEDFTHAGPSVLNLCKTTRQNTQPRIAAGEGTNISRAGHTNIVENAQAVCNEPINSVCLHTRGRAVAAATAVSVKGVLLALSFFGRDCCGNTSGSWIAGAVALPAAGLPIYIEPVFTSLMKGSKSLLPISDILVFVLLTCFRIKRHMQQRWSTHSLLSNQTVCAKRTENEHSSSELIARDTKAAAKRPLFPQPSLEAKKKKGGYMRGRKKY